MGTIKYFFRIIFILIIMVLILPSVFFISGGAKGQNNYSYKTVKSDFSKVNNLNNNKITDGEKKILQSFPISPFSDKEQEEQKNINNNKIENIQKTITDYAKNQSNSISASDVTSYINNYIAAINFGSRYTFNVGDTDYISAASLSSNTFVVAYRDVNYGRAIVGTVSGTTISFGSEYIFNNDNLLDISVAALSSNSFVVAYRDLSGSSVWYGTAVIGTVSGTTISFGSKYAFNNNYTSYTSVTALSSTSFAVAYVDYGSDPFGNCQGTAVIGTVSGSTISYGSEYIFESDNITFTSIAALSSTNFVVAYRDGGNSFYGSTIIGTVSGSTISYGSEYVFNNGATYYLHVSALSPTNFVVGYDDFDNSWYGTAIIGTVSGSTISYGSEYVFNNDYTHYLTTARLSSSKFVVAYNNGAGGAAVIGTVSGSAINFSSRYAFNSEWVHYPAVTNLSLTRFAISYVDNPGFTSYYGRSVIGTDVPSAPTGVTATDGEFTDWVNISWTKTTGATGYRVYRDGEQISSDLGDVDTFNDVTASAPTINSGTTVATKGTEPLGINISLSGTSTNPGLSHTYIVRAIENGEESSDSNPDVGYRGVGNLIYQWQRSSGDSDTDYSNIIGANTPTYSDVAAPDFVVNPPNSVVATPLSTTSISVAFSEATITPGDGRYYRCILNAAGASQQSSTSDRGYRSDAIAKSNGYEIFSDSQPSGSYSTSEGTTSASPFIDTVLLPDTTKFYKVAARSESGVWSNSSDTYGETTTLGLSPLARAGVALATIAIISILFTSIIVLKRI